MAILTLTNTNFLSSTISNNNKKFYDSSKKSAGIFGISNEQVGRLGTPSGTTYIADISSSPSPYLDFRFNTTSALQFLINGSTNLAVFSSDIQQRETLEIFVQSLAVYLGSKKISETIVDFNATTKVSTSLESYLSVLSALLLIRISDQYLYFLVDICKQKFLKQNS